MGPEKHSTFESLAHVGDDASLRYLPIAVLPLTAKFVNADADAVEVEVCELSVRLVAQVDAAIDAEGEEVHELGVVRVVYPVGKRLAAHHSIDDVARK